MKQKKLLIIVFLFTAILTVIIFGLKEKNSLDGNDLNNESNNLISVLVDGVEQSAFPSKGSAEYQSTSCTNGETAVWDATNWKLSIQDISASTRCVVSFITGGHNVYVTVSGGTVDNAPKQVNHNGNTTFTVASSNSNYVFSSVKCTGANSYSWANNVLSVNGVTADAYCDVVFSRPTYTVYFNVTGGYTSNNYVSVVRGGGNSTTFGAIAGYLTSGSTIVCDPGITGKIAGDRIVISNVLSSGDCNIQCAKDSSNYLPGGGVYNVGDEVSYANLAWQVVSDNGPSVTLILKGNAIYSSTSSSNLTGTGIFGSGVTYTSSSARSYLVDIWLEQDAQKYLRNAINSEGLEYQDDANGYIRLPYAAEVNTSLPNASETNFWTMDNDGAGHVYYGQPSGYLTNGKNTSDNKYYFEHYTLASNTSVNYSWSSNLGISYSTTCGGVSMIKRCRYSSRTCYISFCNAYGMDNLANEVGSYVSGTRYVSCAGTNAGGTDPSWNAGCDSTCANQTCAATLSQTLNPVSGASYNPGSYSNGYKKWVKNVGTEVNSSTATKNTTLTYSNTTTGNSGMTTAVQAILPTASSARINDDVPTNNGNQTLTGIGSCALSGTYYQGYNTSSCAAITFTNPSISQSTAITNSVPTRTYVRYTLKNHNSSTMGYRPVIVVYKAN